MAILTFDANVNKTVTIAGNVFTITVPNLPEEIRMFVNEVEVFSGDVIELTENAVITYEVVITPAKVTVNVSNYNTAKFNNAPITDGQTLLIEGDTNTFEFTGATNIPPVTINGQGITGFSVNSGTYTENDLPFTFVPQGGITNSIFVDGSVNPDAYITLAGTNIEELTVNGEIRQLPFKSLVNEPLTMAVSGKIFQVDIESIGGTTITKDGIKLTDGNSHYHTMIDIDKDSYLKFDGTHKLEVNGDNIKSLNFNGVVIPVANLPITVTNALMSANISVNGFEPSEVHLSGTHLDTAILDGYNIPLGENGNLSYEFLTREENHFVNLVGSQPRQLGITWEDNSTTIIRLNGQVVQSGTMSLIDRDVMVSARPIPVPIHFETQRGVILQINGTRYTTNDFVFNADSLTEVDVTATTCELTISYGDNSSRIVVAQGMTELLAPHRDGWIFDGWSSSDVGIISPKSVLTMADLSGRTSVKITCHYQRHPTFNKPNQFN